MKKFSFLLFCLYCISCSPTKTIGFHCEEQHVEIYVDGNYLGRGLVNYTLPRKQENVQVSCWENGKEIYTRTFYVKGKKETLYELQIPKDYRYSNKPYFN